jgi:hypothetical protein
MARSKYTERFCPYCNRKTKMEIIGAMEGVADKTWFKCTRCRHMSLLSAIVGAGAAISVDRSTATPYNPRSSYAVGQAIFHEEWDDVGKVTSKVRMSNGSNAMIVEFEKLGERRLAENLKLDLPVDAAPNGENGIGTGNL